MKRPTSAYYLFLNASSKTHSKADGFLNSTSNFLYIDVCKIGIYEKEFLTEIPPRAPPVVSKVSFRCLEGHTQLGAI
jgi:hypothetical protein